MNVKDLARKYEAFDGRVTFWMLPYRSLRTDISVDAIESSGEPQAVYVHKKTGERVFKEPKAYKKALDVAAKLKTPFKSDWERKGLWTTLHSTFYICDAATVAIDFAPFDETTPAEVRALAAYWEARSASAEESWQVFKQMIGTATTNAWWAAYNATRDKEYNAPSAIQSPGEDADPQAESAMNE